MELDNIKLQTTWNDAAGSINLNFLKVKQAIATLIAEGGGLDEEQLAAYLQANGYTTEQWIALQEFAKKSDLEDYTEARIIHIAVEIGSSLTDEQKAYNAETYRKIAAGEKMLIQIVSDNEIIVPTTIAYGNGVATLERTKVDNSKNGDTVTVTLREDGTASLMTTLLLFPTVDREMLDYSYNAIANAVVKQYIDDEIVKAKPVYDKGMSDTSENAVSNRVIKEYVDALLGYAPLHTLYDIRTIVNTPDAIDDIARQRLYQLIGYTEGGEIPTDSQWFIDTNGFHYVIVAMDSGNGTPVIMILGNEGYTLIHPDNTKQNELLADKTTLADVKAYTDGKFFSQAQFDPAKTHDYVKSYIHYDDEAPKTLEIGVDLRIKDDIANAAEDDLDNGIFNNGLVTALGVKKYVSNLGVVDEELLEGYMPMSRDFSEDFNNDFAR